MTGRGTDLIKASVWFVCVCAVLGFVSVTDFAEPRSKPSTPMVIFSVGEYHTADPVTRKAVTSQGIDPIVIIEGKTYKKPPSDKNELVKFGNSYYRLGQTYRLLFGGSEAGKISVKKWSESDLLADGCYDAGAEVEIKSSVKFADGIGALATNSKVLGHLKSSRRAASSAERTEAVKLAQEAYRKNSVPAALLQSIRLKNITATDLTGDGVIELIGNFEVGDKYTPHTLFLIAAKQDDTYQAELTWYHHAVEEADYEARSFVDQLDLDGDGIDEVISAGHYYEGGDYQIYKKQKGQWQVIYQGGGGGC